MDYFAYKKGQLWCEDTRVAALAREYGTPLYIYSGRTIREHYRRLREAFSAVCGSPGAGTTPSREVLVCYSVKANPNLAILDLLRAEGAGFDVVSGGELFRALRVGADPKKIVFAGVGKTDAEIAMGLDAGILMFNVESEAELDNVERIAKKKRTIARVALRINPDVDPKTHRYIATGRHENKFGIDLATARRIVEHWRRRRAVQLVGLHVHIGSQLLSVEPYVAALAKVADFSDFCRKYTGTLEWVDMGGGFGVFYREHEALPAKEFADAVLPIVDRIGKKLILEPGRFIVGNAGILVTEVLYTKNSGDRVFVICDSGMNDLIRPALYGAFHRIWPVRYRSRPGVRAFAGCYGEEVTASSHKIREESSAEEVGVVENPTCPPFSKGGSAVSPLSQKWGGGDFFPPRERPSSKTVADVVGPVCESGDFFAKERRLPVVSRGDLLAVFTAGAYGYSMASNYNSRPRPAEVLADGKRHRLVSQRETYEDLVRREE